MNEVPTCEQCGAVLDSSAPEGLCPRCVLAVVGNIRLDDPVSEGGSTKAGDSAEQTPALSPMEGFADLTGTTIGRYELLQQIGEGGFGIVFMAEQTEPVQRKVALKIIKAGMDTREVIARFEAERQALALMDHPNIAQVLDGGTTANGRPYFVMELVRGLPITEYCDQANLSTRERLELFIKVCRAVQHAHQKGVIHRDLKPNNVMVTLHDGEPVPKVIDFGVAKALGQKLTEKTLFTRFEQMIGTPAYMSPEQAALGSLDIDTRSDIYSLGAVLYELLTGVTPLDAETLRQGALDEIRRMIQETEPPKPSTRVLTLGERMTKVAKHRQAEPSSLNRLLRGDLDWITMKALEKDRQRRYATVNGMAADIERHLKNEPVVARPRTTAYRLQRAVRRHRVAFTAGAAVTLTLVLGIIISVWEAVRATRAEREQARLLHIAQQAEMAADVNAKSAQAEARRSRRNQYAADMFAMQHALAAGNLGHARNLLNEHLPRPDGEDLRGFEWRFWRTISEGGQSKTLRGHSDTVYAVAWSPDGNLVASGSWDGTVRLWDVTKGETIAILKAHTSRLTSVAFSPDGHLLATGGDDSLLCLWDMNSRSILLTITNRSPRAVFSPNGSLLAVGTGGDIWGESPGEVDLLNAATGQLVRRLPLSGDRAVFSSDGTQLVTANGQPRIAVWDVATGQILKSTPARGQHVQALAFSPEGGVVAFGTHRGGIYVWNLQDETPIALRMPTHGNVTSLSFSPDGRRLVAARQSHELELWDVREHQQIEKLLGHSGEVWAVSYSPDGSALASASQDRTVMIWNSERTNNNELRLSEPLDLYLWLGHPCFSPDGRSLAVCKDQTNVEIFDARTLRSISVLTNAGLPVTFEGGGEHLLTCDRQVRQLKRWNVNDRELISNVRVEFDSSDAFAGAVSADGGVIGLASTEGLVWFVDSRSGKQTGQLSLDMKPHNLGFPHAGRAIAIGGAVKGRGVVEVWDIGSGQRLWRLEGHMQAVSAVAFTRDDRTLVTGSWDSTLKLWDLTTGKEIATLSGHKAGVVCCEVSAEGRTLVSSSDDRTVKFWNLPTFKEVASFEVYEPPHLLRFSRDGGLMLSGGGENILHFWRGLSFSDVEALDRVVASKPKGL